jgi:flagellar assembly factor FliW
MSPLQLVERVSSEPELLAVRSDLLGDLEVRATDVFTFPKGVLGFPECRRFALLRGARDGLYWLQSLDYPALAFLLMDPFTVMTNYTVDIEPWQVVDLGGAEPSDIGVLAIVTLPSQRGEPATANLQAPLAFNFRTRRAKQIIRADESHGVRCPVDLQRFVA